MYTFAKKILTADTHHFTYYRGKAKLAFGEVLHLWQHDHVFRDFHIKTMKSIPFQAYRWETPPLTSLTRNRPFEYVAIDAPYLDRPARRQDFATYFNTSEQVVDFANLGHDAWLIAPVADEPAPIYTQIGAFTRMAQSDQQHTLWQRVGQCVATRCSEKQLWLNTAGDGVPWLHVRIDSRPKYYQHRPYKIFRGTPENKDPS